MGGELKCKIALHSNGKKKKKMPCISALHQILYTSAQPNTFMCRPLQFSVDRSQSCLRIATTASPVSAADLRNIEVCHYTQRRTMGMLYINVWPCQSYHHCSDSSSAGRFCLLWLHTLLVWLLCETYFEGFWVSDNPSVELIVGLCCNPLIILCVGAGVSIKQMTSDCTYHRR